MSGFVARHAASARSLTVITGIVCTALVFGAGANAKPSLAEQVRAQKIEIGKPILPLMRLSVKKGVWRTPEQADAFQAAHPMLGLQKLAPRPRIPMGLAAYNALKQKLAQEPRGQKTTGHNPAPPPANPTHLLLQAAGPSQTDPGNATYPPDASVAIGGSQIVAAVNSTYNVYNRQGALLQSHSLASRFATADQIVQPRVLYDPVWKRWITTAVSANSVSEWIAVSKGPSATGPICITHLHFLPSTDVLDYDILGMTQDALLLTANWFTGATFNGPVIFGISKAKIYNCLPWVSVVYLPGSAFNTVAPPVVSDDNVNAFLVTGDGTNMNLFVGTNLDSYSQESFVLQAQIPYTFSVPPDARQTNSTEVLDTLDGRFTGPSTQTTDLSSFDVVLYNAHTEYLFGYPGPKFFEVDTVTDTIAQSGNFFESGSSDDFNPSIAANDQGDVFVTWNSTDVFAATPHNVRARFSGRQAADGTGIIGAGRVIAYGGPPMEGNPLSAGVQAWGAYSAVALDPYPAQNCSNAPNRRAAIFNERIVNRNVWGTEFGIVGFC